MFFLLLIILNFRIVNAYAYFSRSIRVQSPRLQQFLSENDAELIRNIIRNEVQLSETRIKTEISEFKRRRNLENLTTSWRHYRNNPPCYLKRASEEK